MIQRAIRAVTAEDREPVMRIGRAALAEWWGRDAFVDAVLGDPTRQILLAPDEAGRPVAFIDYRRELGEIRVHNLATHPSHRRRGHATSLLRRVIEDSPARGVLEISLEVRRSNGAAIRLYRRIGFETIGVRQLYYRQPLPDQGRSPTGAEGEDALFMKLVLPRCDCSRVRRGS
jgi:ribosomal-protein-alanine N-acetyltransferase